MSRIILIILSLLLMTNCYADQLLLTPQEMQKLKKYFPTSETEEADDNMHYLWKGDAIKINLPLNQEKRIIFPNKITPDLKGALTTDQIRLINDDKSLYLTAKQKFANVRMYVTVENSNEVILIDLSTDEKADSTPIYIDFTQTKNNTQNLTTNTINNNTNLSSSDNLESPVSDNDNYVILIRFAWQQLYSPENLLNNPLNITRSPMHTDYMVSDLIYGDKVYAHPIASWSYQNNFVTALELRNKYPHQTRININSDICGDWQAASLYPRSLLQASGNKKSDSAVLFLISQKPFHEAMEVCGGSA